MIISAPAKTQSYKINADTATATTAWDSIAFTIEIHNLIISNIATSGTELLWGAIYNDTGRGYTLPVRQGETIEMPNINPKFLRFKSSSGTIKFRYLGW
jgi:hypothetical protein